MVCVFIVHIISAQTIPCTDSIQSTILRSGFFQPGEDFMSASTIDNGTIVGQNTPGNSGALLVFKTDKAGNTQWAKKIAESKSIAWQNMYELSNGNIAFRSKDYPAANGNILSYHLALDANGNFLWQMDYLNQDADTGYQVINSGTNGIIIAAGKRTGANGGGLIVDCEDVLNSGNIWTKNFSINNQFADFAIYNLYVINDAIFIGGTYIDTVSTNSPSGIWILKLDYNTGNIIQCQSYQLNNSTTGQDSLYLAKGYFKALANNNFIFSIGLVNKSNTKKETALIRLDGNLNINKPVIAVYSTLSPAVTTISKTSKTGYSIYTIPHLDGQGFNNAYIDSNNIIQRQTTTCYTGAGAATPQFNFSDDTIIHAIIPEENAGNLDFKIIGLLPDALYNSGCITISDSNFAASRFLQSKKSGIRWSALSGFEKATISMPVRNADDFTIGQFHDCMLKSTCDNIKIFGDNNVCSGDSLIPFTTTKNNFCHNMASWISDTNFITIKNHLNDSTVLLQFTAPGQTWLYANIGKCAIKDSILITIRKPKKIDLGNDTSICPGNTIVLNTNADFHNYLWQDGSSLPAFTVTQTGKYYVSASNDCHTITSDTINIAYTQQPIPSIATNTILCKGQNDILHAGNGFSSYIWQDGSAKEYMAVEQPGKFWVTVADSNKCKGSDTVTIAAIHDLPDNFIFSDTSLCPGNTIILKTYTGQFLKYLWNDGSQQTDIVVNKTGIYSLQVTDTNQCTGKALINVTVANCNNQMVFPNAFSPNRDGKNDIFKPFITGILRNYQLTIYNRSGNVVFKTTDASHGWDGRYKGQINDWSGFAWICAYQFTDRQPETAKGTVILIR